MTYATESARLAREPFAVVELELDYCQEVYGVSPCTAALSAGNECYNTRKTCQDPANYNLGTKTYRFCEARNNLPAGVDMIPALMSPPTFTPTRIEPGKGLGFRGAVTIKIKDFPHHDRGIDPYVSTRAAASGTFFGRLLARNPYYVGRLIKVRQGYITDPFDWNNFEDRVYIIEKFDRDKNGDVTIIGKDLLKKADSDRAQCPVANAGKLLADITAVDSSLTLTPAGIGSSEYAASGTARIGDEIVTFTRSGDAVTITARSQWGTTASDHSADDLFQECKVYTNENVTDIIDDLLTTYAGIASGYIPSADWTTEKNLWLSSSNFTAIISKPEGVDKLLGELTIQGHLNVYWSESAQEIKLKAIAPPLLNVNPTAIGEYDILADSAKITDEKKQRVSQVWVYWNIGDHTQEADTNYQNLNISADLTKEGADQYGEKQVKVIKSRWISSDAQANQLAGRYLARFKDSPKAISFDLDLKDQAIRPGDLIDITTRHLQDVDGSNMATRAQIVEYKESDKKLSYMALTQEYSGRYAFIAANTMGDYSAESATNKESYAFVCLNTGLFADGTEGHKVI